MGMYISSLGPRSGELRCSLRLEKHEALQPQDLNLTGDGHTEPLKVPDQVLLGQPGLVG